MYNLLIIEDVADVNAMLFEFFTHAGYNVLSLGLSIVKLLSEKLGGKAISTIENGMITFQIKLRKKLQQN